MKTARDHWDDVYAHRAPDEVSWYRPHLDRSLDFIATARLRPDARIIDVGGGTSTLVDDLLTRGHTNVTVLDLSASAIETARVRLGDKGNVVRWLVADVTDAALDIGPYDFWHDRAVFHFLRDEVERRRYVAAVRRAVTPGGYVLIATFGHDGPQRCSGLDVVRYDADELHAEFGSDFRKLSSLTEIHRTPQGSDQQFVYCCCRIAPV